MLKGGGKETMRPLMTLALTLPYLAIHLIHACHSFIHPFKLASWISFHYFPSIILYFILLPLPSLLFIPFLFFYSLLFSFLLLLFTSVDYVPSFSSFLPFFTLIYFPTHLISIVSLPYFTTLIVETLQEWESFIRYFGLSAGQHAMGESPGEGSSFFAPLCSS